MKQEQAGFPGQLQVLHPAATSPGRFCSSASNSMQTNDHFERVGNAAEADLTVNVSTAEQTIEANISCGRSPTWLKIII